jgi:hypothetical protein
MAHVLTVVVLLVRVDVDTVVGAVLTVLVVVIVDVVVEVDSIVDVVCSAQ